MKIAWFCIPAHGHTNPTLGIVKALTDAGHQVYYFSFEMFREKIEQAGGTFIGCDGCDFEMEDKENADRVGKDKVFATELLVSSTLALDGMTSEKIREIRPDIVISDSVAFWGKLAAMKHGIPYVCSTTTFAFNRFSAKYMQESPWDIAKMLF
ncbi:MAG: glucosyltransferase, partial [Clostridiales bacterium]|nr:glucosyltransferase [Clostridiales bacterium]